jgi:hypothetical protein
MSLRLNGSTSGYTELDAGAVAGNNTIKMPTANGNAYQVLRNGATAGTTEFADNIVSGTAVASTSGTSIDFTGIPSWVKRVTVMFSGVSTSGTSSLLVQTGSGSFDTSGYIGAASQLNASSLVTSNSTAGYLMQSGSAANTISGALRITLLASNVWVAEGILGLSNTTTTCTVAGSRSTSGTLDRIRITTVNGTDTFDAGTINILYE